MSVRTCLIRCRAEKQKKQNQFCAFKNIQRCIVLAYAKKLLVAQPKLVLEAPICMPQNPSITNNPIISGPNVIRVRVLLQSETALPAKCKLMPTHTHRICPGLSGEVPTNALIIRVPN